MRRGQHTIHRDRQRKIRLHATVGFRKGAPPRLLTRECNDSTGATWVGHPTPKRPRHDDDTVPVQARYIGTLLSQFSGLQSNADTMMGRLLVLQVLRPRGSRARTTRRAGRESDRHGRTTASSRLLTRPPAAQPTPLPSHYSGNDPLNRHMASCNT